MSTDFKYAVIFKGKMLKMRVSYIGISTLFQILYVFSVSWQHIFKDHNRNLVNGEIELPALTTKTAKFTIDHALLLC